MKNSNCSRGNKGYTLIELITVLAIMSILGSVLVSMLNVGVNFYRTENLSMNNQNSARLAISYITVKIRQHDVANDGSTGNFISVVQPLSSDSSFNALEIYDSNSPVNPFWIYFDSNTHMLREQSGNPVFDQALQDGMEITDLSDFNYIIPFGADKFGTNIIQFEAKDGSVDLTQNINLRSHPS